jgi:hypothetical protein
MAAEARTGLLLDTSSACHTTLPDPTICNYDRMVPDDCLLQNDWRRPQLNVEGLNYSTHIFHPDQLPGDVTYLCRQYPVYVAASNKSASRIFPSIVSDEEEFQLQFLGENSFALFTKFLQPYVKLRVGYRLSKKGRIYLTIKTSTPTILDGKTVSPSPRAIRLTRFEWNPNFEPVIAMHHSPMKRHYINLYQGREIHNKQRPRVTSAFLNSLPEPRFVQIGVKDTTIRNTQAVVLRPNRKGPTGRGVLKLRLRRNSMI